MTETKERYSVVDQVVFDRLLEVMTPQQILSMVEGLVKVKETGHGEVALVVKNGELYYLDVRLSVSIRRDV